MGIAININAQDSPILTLGTVTTAAPTVAVSVTATNFNSIKACDLKILYDPAIVEPTGIIKGTGLGGSLSVNLSNPGEIIIGWYSSIAVSMTDGSAIFNITFNKLSSGISNLSFDVIYNNDCQFYNSTNQKLNDAPPDSFYKAGSITINNDSPVTSAPTLTPSLNDDLNIPVTVTGFDNIGAVCFIFY
jgi:hypothetical protein